MKFLPLLVLGIIFIGVSTFTLINDKQNHLLQGQSSLQDCSSTQSNAAYAAISVCQSVNLYSTVQCIKGYMQDKLNQKWNAFARGPTYTNDTIRFWTVDRCYLNLFLYGKFNRRYTIWPIQTYNSTSQQSEPVPEKDQNPGDNCDFSRTGTVNYAVHFCDMMQTINDATLCIQGMIESKYFGDEWNVFIAQSNQSDSDVAYWYADDCTFEYTNYQRKYIVWKNK